MCALLECVFLTMEFESMQFAICKAPPMHVPEPPAPFIGDARPSNTPSMSLELLTFGCIRHRLAPALAPTQSVLATQLPAPRKAAQAKNAPPPTQSTHAISTHPLRGKPMATIRENSTTVVGVPKVKPPGLRSEGLTKASSLDQPREDAYAKHAPTSARAEILDIEE